MSVSRVMGDRSAYVLVCPPDLTPPAWSVRVMRRIIVSDARIGSYAKREHDKWGPPGWPVSCPRYAAAFPALYHLSRTCCSLALAFMDEAWAQHNEVQRDDTVWFDGHLCKPCVETLHAAMAATAILLRDAR